MSHNLSLSKYHNAAGALEDPPTGCAYPYRPDIELPFTPTGKAGRIGKGIHRLSDAAVKRTVDTLDDMDPNEAAEAMAIFSGPLRGYVEAWRDEPADVKHSELRLRYDARIGRVWEAPRRDDPGYTRPEAHHVTGEMDLSRKLGDIAECEDIKSGSPRNVHEEQLLAYGVLVARFYGVSRVRVRFLYALKTKLTPTPWVEMDADRLDGEAGRIAKVLRRLPTAEPIEGDWCEGWRCPLGKGACPLWTRQEMQSRIEAGAL